MGDIFNKNKKFFNIWGKMDDRILKSKIDKSIELLQNPDTSELEKKLNKIDKNDLLAKLDEFDETKLDELNIDKEELKEKISSIDLKKVSDILGENGDEIILKLQKLLN